jgi:NADPH-dependent 2,4-dienoyl-CoA reductase/sulfur reductase-like enzyme
VTLENGQRVAYDRLLLANGARARLLPCVPPELTDKVHYVRTKQDAERIRSKVQVGKRAVMIGGGIIGIETAATLRQLGCEATVLEMAQRIVERLFPPELSQVIASIHINRGVKILTGVVIESIKSSTDGVVVTLTDGRVLPADILVIGIGIVPNVELGAEAGLDTQLNGIAVNGFGQTSCPSIYAVGDVTAFKLPSGSVRRWENWTHARKLAAVAVKHMLGKQPAPYFDYPWVWSDQYGMNIQVFGDPEGHVIDQVVMRGNLDSGRLTAFHLNRGRVIGGTTINDSRNKASVRKLIERGTIVPPELLVDTTLDLKKLVASL